MSTKDFKQLLDGEEITVEMVASDGTLMWVNIERIGDKLYATADTGETLILTPGNTQVHQ